MIHHRPHVIGHLGRLGRVGWVGGLGLWTGLFLFLALSSPAAAAELQQVEAVGAVPVKTGSNQAPRDAALAEALREAVLRATRELLHDEDLPGDGDSETDPDAALTAVLGEDMLSYASRFRIIEDRGERPALFVDEPGVTSEYVVVVEVHVDIERLKARLVEHDLLSSDDFDSGRGRQVRVSLDGVGTHAAYEAVRTLLLEGVGAASALPVEFEERRAVFAVEWEESPSLLFDRMRQQAPDGLTVTLVDSGRDRLELAIAWRGDSGASRPADVDAGPPGRSRGTSRH